MPVLSLSKSYDDTVVLTAADLTEWLSELEVFTNTTKLDDANLQDAGIEANVAIADTSITSAKLAANAVTAAKLATSGISSTTVINTSAVTTDKLAADAVTTGKLSTNAVVTAAITAGAITKAKLAAINDYSYDSTDEAGYTTETTICTAAITTTGRPVQLNITTSQGSWYSTIALANSATRSSISAYVASGVSTAAERSIDISVYRDGTLISKCKQGAKFVIAYSGSGGADYPLDLCIIDAAPSAAAHTYTVTITQNAAATAYLKHAKLYVREL